MALDERSWGAQRTTSARADIDGDGIATYTFDFSWDFRASDIGPVDLVHFGSVSALSEPGANQPARPPPGRPPPEAVHHHL